MSDNITIKDVAREAGVSITTVSLILNNKAKNISLATIQRVNDVCKKLNFSRNVFACSLKNKESKIIGLIIPDLENTYYARVANIISTKAGEQGYITIISSTNNDFDKEMKFIMEMGMRRVDALLLFPSTSSLKENNLKLLHEVINASKLKIVLIDRLADIEKCSAIINDNASGAVMATDYLINKGYKHIACITGPEYLSSSVERLNGYKESLKKHHIPFNKDLVFVGDYSFNTAKSIAEMILKNKDIDAIFAFNDESAYAVYDVADKLNLKVGIDIALIGYDDNPFSNLISPKLSSVRQNVEQMCDLAIDYLIHDKPVEIIRVEPTLIERDSAL